MQGKEEMVISEENITEVQVLVFSEILMQLSQCSKTLKYLKSVKKTL